MLQKRREVRALGVVRYHDTLGRFSIPKYTRKHFGWGPGTPLEFLTSVVNGEPVIVIQKFDPERGFRSG